MIASWSLRVPRLFVVAHGCLDRRLSFVPAQGLRKLLLEFAALRGALDLLVVAVGSRVEVVDDVGKPAEHALGGLWPR